MAKTEAELEREKAEAFIKLALNEPEPGKFISPFEDFPGYIKLPHPFLGRHYKAWIRAEAKEVTDEVEKLPAFGQWRAAFSLVEKFALQNLAPADLTEEGDNVPIKVQTWIRLVVAEYLSRNLDLKNLLEPSGTT